MGKRGGERWEKTAELAGPIIRFNPWWGCTKVSPGCDNCYAEAFAQRIGHDVWGPGKIRRLFGSNHWDKPRRWDRHAKKKGIRERVFCGSMCDIFETDNMNGWMNHARLGLWALISETPSLDWLLLTKRIENVASMVPDNWPFENVWLGVTVENQEMADERIPILLDTKAAVRWVSVEPMLESIDLECWLMSCYDCDSLGSSVYSRDLLCEGACGRQGEGPSLDWVVCGSESGLNRRPFEIRWALWLKEQCDEAGTAFFGKQRSALHPGKPLLINGREWKELPR